MNDKEIMKAETNPNPEAEIQEVMPLADILECEDGVTMWFEIPGANSKTVTIEVRNKVLSVRAASTLRKGGRSILVRREFQLSDLIDVENISAKTADGVLTLVLPKCERAKVHRIKVS